jgi:hypothetical protein
MAHACSWVAFYSNRPEVGAMNINLTITNPTLGTKQCNTIAFTNPFDSAAGYSSSLTFLAGGLAYARRAPAVGGLAAHAFEQL